MCHKFRCLSKLFFTANCKPQKVSNRHTPTPQGDIQYKWDSCPCDTEVHPQPQFQNIIGIWDQMLKYT